MSCKHGNWAPCDQCDEEDAIYKKHAAEIADHERAYELLFKENAKLRAQIEGQQPPCLGANCGSTIPRLHSAECFSEHEALVTRIGGA